VRTYDDVVKYMLLMWGDGTDADGQAAAQVCEAGWSQWVAEMQERGVVLHDGGALASTSRSATVQVSGLAVLVADGPFAETKEQVGGYQLIECANREEAIHAASRHPLAQSGVIVEVRPIIPL
jgi:hypothetical protein